MEVAGLAVIVAGLFVLFAYAVIVARNGDVEQCKQAVPAGSPIGPILAAVAIAGLILGRVVAELRKRIHQAPALRDIEFVSTTGWLQVALAAFLVMAAVLLGYETYAVAHFDQAPPITEYVRCAAGSSPWLTGLGTLAVTTLLGSWLWYPTR